MKAPFAKVIPFIMLMLLGVGASLSPAAAAGTSARSVLQVFRKEMGDEASKGVVVLRGTKGQDQPALWEIIVRDARFGGSVAYLVDEKRIVRSGRIKGEVGGAPVEAGSIRIDSTQAFRIADAEARKSRVGFDSIDYELRAIAPGSTPVWSVRLRDAAGRETAVVEIDGTSGRITDGRWRGKPRSGGAAPAAAAGRREPAETVIEESAGEMRAESQSMVDYTKYREGEDKATPEEHRKALGRVWKRSTEGIGSAGTSVKSGFSKIGSAVSDIFRGRAEYRSSGKRGWSPDRGAPSGLR